MKQRILSAALALCLCLSSPSVAYANQEISLSEAALSAGEETPGEEMTEVSEIGGDADTDMEEGSAPEEEPTVEEEEPAPEEKPSEGEEEPAPEEKPAQGEETPGEEMTGEPETGGDADTVPEEEPSEGEEPGPEEEPSQEEETPGEEMTEEPEIGGDADAAPEEDLSPEEDAPVVTCAGTELTPAGVYEAMIALKNKEGYQEGTTWTNDEPYSDSKGYYHWSGGLINGTNIVAVGCVAFAFTLSDAAFGSLPNRMYAAGQFTFEDIKVGDILRVDGDTHTVIVLEVSDAGVVIAEGNYNGKVHWGRTMSRDEVMANTSHYITRYPEGYVSPDDPDADRLIGEGTLAGGLVWELTKAGTLTVSGSGVMPDFVSVAEQPWNGYNDQIRKIVIGNGVTGIGSCAFWGCGALGVEIASGVTEIGSNAFRGASVVAVSLPASVKIVGDSAFRECRNLSSLTLSEGVETIAQNAFRSCTSLPEAALPASIGEVGAGAFFQCTAMKSVAFAPGSREVKLGDNLFTQCYWLMSVTLPQRIDRIGEGMFQNCQMLAGVEIPQGAASIGASAFASSGVSVVVIPDSVTTIGTAAFSACPLTDIYFTGTAEQWEGVSKLGDTASVVSGVNIHYNVTPGVDQDPGPDPVPDPDPDPGPGPNPDPDDGTSPTEYVVTFAAGSGKYSEKYEVGSLISRIPDGVYALVGDASIEGLYTDSLFSARSKWDMGASVVLSDMTLYVRYASQISKDEDGKSAGVRVQTIPNQVYTGADIKPNVMVYAVDGTLLKKDRDYTIIYTKNATTMANMDENGNPVEGVTQPYLTIRGKGNYQSESVKVTFNIVPASIGSRDAFAKGFTAKINESIALGNRPTAAVVSLKYKKAMAIGTDYTVTIKNNGEEKEKGVTTDAKNLPAVNEEGSYTVTVTGKGNYCGTVTRTISVSDKEHLLCNASVKLGSGIKKLDFAAIGTGDGKVDMGSLASGEKTPGADKFSVTAKTKETLSPDQYTYQVIYANGSTTVPAVGKAKLVITAAAGSGYFGSKSVAFTVTGTAAKKGVTLGVSGGRLSDVAYTGKAHTEYNNVEVRTVSDNRRLVHKKDYTITYKNNVKKGTATMIFTMLPASGYTGSIKTTFRITAAKITTGLLADSAGFTMNGDTAASLKEAVSYRKAGAKPAHRISMRLDSGYALREGTDYTIAYRNHNAISNGTKRAVMTVKGKGSFTGSYTVTYDIVPASLEELYRSGDIAVNVIPQAYKTSAKTYAVKIKVTDAGKALSGNKDYVLEGTVDAAAVDAYLHADGARPKVTLSGDRGTSGCYTGAISVPLSFYDPANRLTAKNVTIEFKNAKGDQVDAYYRNGAQVTMDAYLLVYVTNIEGVRELLDADSYTTAWGKNNTAGEKKGTVTITGQGKYGGSVKCTFPIVKLGLTTDA